MSVIKGFLTVVGCVLLALGLSALTMLLVILLGV